MLRDVRPFFVRVRRIPAPMSTKKEFEKHYVWLNPNYITHFYEDTYDGKAFGVFCVALSQITTFYVETAEYDRVVELLTDPLL